MQPFSAPASYYSHNFQHMFAPGPPSIAPMQSKFPTNVINIINPSLGFLDLKIFLSCTTGFRKIIFHPSGVYAAYNSIEEATGAISALLESHYITSTYSNLKPMMSSQPSNAQCNTFRVKVSSTDRHEISGILAAYKGVKDIQYNPSSIIVEFHTLVDASAAAEDLNHTTNLTANFVRKEKLNSARPQKVTSFVSFGRFHYTRDCSNPENSLGVLQLKNIDQDIMSLKILASGFPEFTRIDFFSDSAYNSPLSAQNAFHQLKSAASMSISLDEHYVPAPLRSSVKPTSHILYAALYPSTVSEHDIMTLLRAYEGFERAQVNDRGYLAHFRSVEFATVVFDDSNHSTNLTTNYARRKIAHSSTGYKDTIDSIVPSKTLQIRYLGSHFDRSEIRHVAVQLSGFNRMAFYRDCTFLCFDTLTEASDAIGTLAQQGIRATVTKEEWTRKFTPSSTTEPSACNNTLYVNNLPFNSTEDEFYKIFGNYIGFSGVYFFKGSCKVYFDMVENATQALEEINLKTNLCATYYERWNRDKNVGEGKGDVIEDAREKRATLHVISHTLDKADLKAYFQKSCHGFKRIAFYRDWSFVVFDSIAEAQGAMNQASRDGGLKISFANDEFLPNYLIPDVGEPTDCLNVTQLPWDATNKELSKLFADFEGFSRIRFSKDSCKVHFETRELAGNACHRINIETNLISCYYREEMAARLSSASFLPNSEAEMRILRLKEDEDEVLDETLDEGPITTLKLTNIPMDRAALMNFVEVLDGFKKLFFCSSRSQAFAYFNSKTKAGDAIHSIRNGSEIKAGWAKYNARLTDPAADETRMQDSSTSVQVFGLPADATKGEFERFFSTMQGLFNMSWINSDSVVLSFDSAVAAKIAICSITLKTNLNARYASGGLTKMTSNLSIQSFVSANDSGFSGSSKDLPGNLSIEPDHFLFNGGSSFGLSGINRFGLSKFGMSGFSLGLGANGSSSFLPSSSSSVYLPLEDLLERSNILCLKIAYNQRESVELSSLEKFLWQTSGVQDVKIYGSQAFSVFDEVVSATAAYDDAFFIEQCQSTYHASEVEFVTRNTVPQQLWAVLKISADLMSPENLPDGILSPPQSPMIRQKNSLLQRSNSSILENRV